MTQTLPATPALLDAILAELRDLQDRAEALDAHVEQLSASVAGARDAVEALR